MSLMGDSQSIKVIQHNLQIYTHIPNKLTEHQKTNHHNYNYSAIANTTALKYASCHNGGYHRMQLHYHKNQRHNRQRIEDC